MKIKSVIACGVVDKRSDWAIGTDNHINCVLQSATIAQIAGTETWRILTIFRKALDN